MVFLTIFRSPGALWRMNSGASGSMGLGAGAADLKQRMATSSAESYVYGWTKGFTMDNHQFLMGKL